jgi:hypothetical protein
LLEGEGTFDEVQDDGKAQKAGHQNKDAGGEGQNGEEQQQLERKGNFLAVLGLTDADVNGGHRDSAAGRGHGGFAHRGKIGKGGEVRAFLGSEGGGEEEEEE